MGWDGAHQIVQIATTKGGWGKNFLQFFKVFDFFSVTNFHVEDSNETAAFLFWVSTNIFDKPRLLHSLSTQTVVMETDVPF